MSSKTTKKRLRFIFKVVNGATPLSSNQDYWDGDIPWVTPEDLGDIESNTIIETNRFITEEGLHSCGTSLVPAGSIILSTRAPIGHLALAGRRMCTNQGCRSLVFKTQDNNKYFYYQMIANKAELQSRGEGTTFMELAAPKLKDVWLIHPKYNEQQAIVNFLNHKTTQIDQYIVNKKKQIELLEKIRASIISETLTKGLNLNVEMKDSGVVWMDAIPKHWDIVQFSHFVNFQEGPGIMASDFRDSGVPLLRIANVKNELVELEGCNYLDEEMVNVKWKHFKVNKKDLIISASASTGLVSEVGEEAVGSIPYTGLIRLSAKNSSITRRFIKLFVSSDLFFSQVYILQTGSTMQHFGPAHLTRMKLPLPPKEEQGNIVDFVERKTQKINSGVAMLETQIAIMKSYRTSLISEAVTGKIDVRKFKPEITEALTA